jgi:uncharacterized protein (TIGR04255 family)
MSELFPRSHFRIGSFQSRHYTKAPITEAIITLAIELPVGFEVERLRNFVDGGVQYKPVGEERMMGFTATISGAGTGVSTIDPTINGFRFSDAEGRYILVCRQNSFSLSRLAPYESWEAFRDEARRIWNGFTEKFSTPKVTGLNIRYVNRIEIPWKAGQQIDFRWYFRTFPEVSSDIDVRLAGFYMRLDIPLTSIDARLILNQAMLPASSPSPESISVLLDSDIVSGSEPAGEDEIWNRFEILRKAKNDVFEACITNLTRELFQ